MKKLILAGKARIIIDILLFLGFIGLNGKTGRSWSSSHCIGALIWLLLMAIHIAQHWQFTKSFTKWKVIRKNKITALTILGLILMLSSVLLFCFGFNTSFIEFHHIAGHLFPLVIIIHIVSKFRRFISLFKKERRISSK